jgi:hypothetical protein
MSLVRLTRATLAIATLTLAHWLIPMTFIRLGRD